MSENTPPKLRLDNYLPYRLSVLSNAVSRLIGGVYEGDFDLSIWQWRIIAVLGETPGLTSTEVTQRTLMDKPTVSRAAASLVERGLLRRDVDTEDRRRVPLSLTDAGQAIYNQVIPEAIEKEKALLDVLSEDEQCQLHDILTRLARVASPGTKLWDDF
ncbi:MAG: MarR family transcriptional regulator [Henriciella sp.]|nr:MarR family transcriptional regulator [Henriciella sp.]